MESPKTLIEAVKLFSEYENCHQFMVIVRWADGVVRCPHCQSDKVTHLANAKAYKCRAKHAKQKFTLKTGTVMEDSPIGLSKWLPAFWLLCNSKNGVSSHELGRSLGITQKSAWFTLSKAVPEAYLQGNLNPMKIEIWVRLIGLYDANYVIVFDFMRQDVTEFVPSVSRSYKKTATCADTGCCKLQKPMLIGIGEAPEDLQKGRQHGMRSVEWLDPFDRRQYGRSEAFEPSPSNVLGLSAITNWFRS